MVSLGKGLWVPVRGTAGLVWVWQQLCAGVVPTEQVETFAEGSLGRPGCKRRLQRCAGPDPVTCAPVHESGSNMRPLGARSPEANASEKQKTQQ